MKDFGLDVLEAFDTLDLKDQVLLWSDLSKKLEKNLKTNGYVSEEEINKV